ncbi:MAG: NAD(P)/FAD-dependent oxidoreductase [Anaerolineaceae bacterium]|nr:NAD(P)/FAD-dependent oxidoreductase [Anaerolineaceae bacterium]
MMKNVDVIIVGGGPAGAACAWKLSQHQVDFLVLDKATFPRVKPCAGWITPLVLRDLEIDPADFPLGIKHFTNFQVSIKDFHLKLRTNQYAIRRIEFDDWLLHRSDPLLVHHTVKEISLANDRYLIDNTFSAKTIVGAGGTNCPIQKTFFKNELNGNNGALIVAQEEEFAYEYHDDRCHLWFLQNGLPGYAWYVPKANGFVNVGLGGSAVKLKSNNDSLKRHWRLLVEKLDKMGLVNGHDYKPVGHSYYLRGRNPVVRRGNAYIVGDAIGLATRDMGEGIGPAIQSGFQAAEAILTSQVFSVKSIQKYSFPSLLGFR